MTEAFLEALPGAPTRGLIEPTIGQSWAEAKTQGHNPEQPTAAHLGEYRKAKRRAARGME